MTVRMVDLDDAKARLPELIEEAGRGEEVIITRNEQPVAKLVPYDARSRRGFGSARDQIWMADDFDAPLEDFAEYTS